MPIEQGATCEFDCLGYRCERNAPAPALVADKLPGAAFSDVLKHLPNHYSCAFERRLAVADRWVGHDVPSQLNRFASAAFWFAHKLTLRVRISVDKLRFPWSGYGAS